jgi:23S rRNA pseudouridine1911/1915/1917 synthase
LKFKDLSIIYEDSDIIVINKAAGVLTIPDRYNSEALNLYKILSDEFETIFTCHRLDKDTSGAVVFAKNAESHKFINQLFQDQDLDKIYHAVVKGVVAEDDFEIDIPIMPDPSRRGASTPSARGKASLTLVRVIERYQDATLLKCKIITGRHHQLRVHVAAIGHPLLIDDFYGSAEPFLVSSVKRKKFNLKKHTDEKPLISRITMHAKELNFAHPTSKEKLYFDAEYPKDFKALVQALSKYSKNTNIY